LEIVQNRKQAGFLIKKGRAEALEMDEIDVGEAYKY